MLRKLLILSLVLTPLSILNIERSNQCLNSKSAWVGGEIALPSLLINSSLIYNPYKTLYIKTINTKVPIRGNHNCRSIYAWYEDGLSLNWIDNKTKSLVFPFKVDGKYWLDIRNPKTKEYILKKLIKSNSKYPIHLDDHWAIPIEYGDYQKELNDLTKELYNNIGPFSISVLPYNYAKTNYNVDWTYWLANNLLSEIVLQNYVPNNFEYEVEIFYQLTKKYNLPKKMGIYIRDRNYKKYLKNKYNFETVVFSLRTEIMNRPIKK